MFSRSSRTVRVSGIPLDADAKEVEDYAHWLSADTDRKSSISIFKCIKFWKRNSEPNPEPCAVTLARQSSFQTGTITFSSKVSKQSALKKKGKWACDDAFNSMTVLHSADSPNIDICAVHGLNGNAFDTWASDGKMWLRDFLPYEYPFSKSRIMTFGYSSLLNDENNTAGLSEWAHSLLQALSTTRKTEAERDRPIILICHSLGGLVAREAMIRLYFFPDRYPELNIERFGLLFLSTPHSGAAMADWKEYLVDLAQQTGRVRARLLTNILGSFNNDSRKAKENFGLISPRLPYVCLGEVRKTEVKGYAKMIVSLDSAGLNNEPAQGVDGASHKTICKYSQRTDAGYLQIVDRLEDLGNRLQSTQPTTNGELSCTERNNQRPVGHKPSSIRSLARSIRAGDAHGGDANGDSASGGSASGGGVSMTNKRYNSIKGRVYGGYAQGGNACGSQAFGGIATGGSIVVQ